MALDLTVHSTPIPGLLVIDLPVHGDARGWFKENWQREKMVAAGLPDFAPVQNNISFNQEVGVTRGIHAEPWDKYISVSFGKVFGAWVDLREGDTFGETFWTEITPERAIFVPRGVGNSFQTIEAPAAYTYLVNDHWSAEKQSEYTFLNLADPRAGIPWPIPLSEAELSEKDQRHPFFAQVVPFAATNRDRVSEQAQPPANSQLQPQVKSLAQAPANGELELQAGGQASEETQPRQWKTASDASLATAARTLVIGAGGQLGRALQAQWQGRNDVDYVDRDELDISAALSFESFDFTAYNTIVNAAAYTAVDNAETAEGRRDAWRTNVLGVAALVRAAREVDATLVHLSSDYVFDGSVAFHTEDEEFAPLGVYGQTKAAGDVTVAGLERHYIVRTSWVIGDGNNFVATMCSLAERGINPSVVNDQFGRLSFAVDIAAAIDHLLASQAPYGTYNVSNTGETVTWCDIAKRAFALTGHDPERVTGVSTAEYYDGKTDMSPRPINSTLDLTKIRATGFSPRDQFEALAQYLAPERNRMA